MGNRLLKLLIPFALFVCVLSIFIGCNDSDSKEFVVGKKVNSSNKLPCEISLYSNSSDIEILDADFATVTEAVLTAKRKADENNKDDFVFGQVFYRYIYDAKIVGKVNSKFADKILKVSCRFDKEAYTVNKQLSSNGAQISADGSFVYELEVYSNDPISEFTLERLEIESSKISYSISYKNTFDSLPQDGYGALPDKYTSYDSTFELPPLEKRLDADNEDILYVFDGWYDGNKLVTQIIQGSKGNIELTARWKTKDASLGYGDITINVLVFETDGIRALTQKQIATWLKGKQEYRETYTFAVHSISEYDVGTIMSADAENNVDVYCFTQEQITKLLGANALTALDDVATQFVTANNDESSVNVVKVDEKIYGYPLALSNGYFMYYDKSVVRQESIDELASIVADCKAAKRKFSFELGGQAWYSASFFFGTGCQSTWKNDKTTNKWTATDDFNSDKGLIAMKGMQILTASDVWKDSSDVLDFGAPISSAVVVSGNWFSSLAKQYLGDNYAVAKLPHFTVDGQTYQLGSYSGFHFMGVKPQSNASKLAVCHEVAQLLSGKEAQEERFDLANFCPSNKDVQAMDKIKNDEALAALMAQNVYATPQGQIPDKWWDIAKMLALKTVNEDGTAASEDALQTALIEYQKSIDKLMGVSAEDTNVWGIIGSIASLVGTTENLAEDQTQWFDWCADLAMTKTEKEGVIIWKSSVAIALTPYDEFLIRFCQGWDECYYSESGDSLIADTPAAANTTGEGGTFKAAVSGTYYIVLTINADNSATVELVTSE